ncbi:hypothetical protein C2E21_0299 [Chlorella sorokiniana]|uniref:Uncharacterized protein n=1 Tax=Chlorella sorokiniana TaxID=3076 RepID=A0A2P6U4V8_CHLSO|nr:hypothetical protein C2E21_0299 [Chlorella sorokiniana]|eukprot:PRW61351.1 hypothetical protein C2E21_0299 [Chlorella sorokiniana]
MRSLVALLFAAALAACRAAEVLPAAAALEDLTEQQVEAARNATRDLAAGGSAAAQQAVPVATRPAPVTFAPAPLPEATARRLLRAAAPAPMPETLGRKLLGTLTVNVTQGDIWAYQSKTTVKAAEQETEDGTVKRSVGVARGQALAVNGPECWKEDCDEPIAQVQTSVTPGGAVTGPKATADAIARGSLLSATRTRTDSIDTAQNGDDIAVARASADSYSVQGDGTIARAFSTVQGNAVAGPGFAQWTASGDALAQPFGDYGHKGANVNVQGFALVDSGLYGLEGLAQAIHTYGL